MENPNKNAAKKFIYHTLIGVLWADSHKNEEKAMLLKAQETQAGVEVLELEPSFFGRPLERDFAGRPPPQLFYEVTSFAQGSPTEILISAESMVPQDKWLSPLTECDFVGKLADAVRPAEIAEVAKGLAKQYPTYQASDGDCQTLTMMMMAKFLSLDYLDAADLAAFVSTGDALDNTVEHAINNAVGRPAVITALQAARTELYDVFDDWIFEHLEVSDWSEQDLEVVDALCAKNQFAGGQWSSNPALQQAWDKSVLASRQERSLITGSYTDMATARKQSATARFSEFCIHRTLGLTPRGMSGLKKQLVDYNREEDMAKRAGNSGDPIPSPSPQGEGAAKGGSEVVLSGAAKGRFKSLLNLWRHRSEGSNR